MTKKKKAPPSKSPRYLLFDERWRTDPDRAIVMDTAYTLAAIRHARKHHGNGVMVDARFQVEVR